MSVRQWLRSAAEHINRRRQPDEIDQRDAEAWPKIIEEGLAPEPSAERPSPVPPSERRAYSTGSSGREVADQPDSRMAAETAPRPERLLMTFETTRDLEAALALEIEGIGGKPLISARRRFVSVSLPAENAAEAATRLWTVAQRYRGTIVPDYRYDLEPAGIFEAVDRQTDDPTRPCLDDVLARINATQAWSKTRGQDVVIAVVDTGINGSRPEFPVEKRAGGWFPPDDPEMDAWVDWHGHGTMCATIAAGSRALGGAFDGVAPHARIFSCKTQLYASELAEIYDTLTALANTGVTVIATNSFGRRVGAPPVFDAEDDPFLAAMAEAIAAGVHVFFSAGNNHALAGGQPDQCQPNSIWLHKSRDDVFVVAACDLEGSMWEYSSRGPGQYFGQPETNRKPDATAPTPRHGRIVFGNDIQVLPNGWGTSGACPQAAGLAALLLSLRPDLPRERLFSIIRDTASPLGHSPLCEGSGLLDCHAALNRLIAE